MQINISDLETFGIESLQIYDNFKKLNLIGIDVKISALGPDKRLHEHLYLNILELFDQLRELQ